MMPLLAALIPGISWWKIIAVGAVAVALATGGYWFKGVIAENAELRQHISSLEILYQQEQANHNRTKTTFATWRADMNQQIEDQKQERKKVEAQYSRARKEAQEIGNKLSQHDLGFLAKKKPGLVARRVNRGTQRVFNELQSLTAGFATGGIPTPSSGDTTATETPRALPKAN